MRFILLLMLLTTFVVTSKGRSILDPIGGGSSVTVNSDQGPGTDPDGRNAVGGITSDAGPRMDPDG